MRELDIDIEQYSMMGGEYQELSGRVPGLLIECLEYLLKQHDDNEARELLRRLKEG